MASTKTVCSNCGCKLLSRAEMIRKEFAGRRVTNATVGRKFGWSPLKAGIALRDVMRRGFAEKVQRATYDIYPVGLLAEE